MEWKKTGIAILSMSMALLFGGCSSEGHVTAYTAEPYYLYAEAMKSAGNVKASVIEKYDSIVGIYKEKMKEFRHKDQKPYWH